MRFFFHFKDNIKISVKLKLKKMEMKFQYLVSTVMLSILLITSLINTLSIEDIDGDDNIEDDDNDSFIRYFLVKTLKKQLSRHRAMISKSPQITAENLNRITEVIIVNYYYLTTQLDSFFNYYYLFIVQKNDTIVEYFIGRLHSNYFIKYYFI
jgi:hypothetical protein